MFACNIDQACELCCRLATVVEGVVFRRRSKLQYHIPACLRLLRQRVPLPEVVRKWDFCLISLMLCVKLISLSSAALSLWELTSPESAVAVSCKLCACAVGFAPHNMIVAKVVTVSQHHLRSEAEP
jgi:hypothetical protein